MVDFFCVVFVQIAFSLNAFYVKKKVFIFSHTSHVLATFAKTSDDDMIINIIKLFFKMRTTVSSPSSCLSFNYHNLASKAQTKSIPSSMLSMLWAFLLVSLINAEALNSDNHVARSKIFEEKGNYFNTVTECFHSLLFSKMGFSAVKSF